MNESSAEYDERNGEDEDEEEMRRSPAEDADTEIVTPSNLGEHLEHAAAQPTHSNIPVQRLVQSVKQVPQKYFLSLLENISQFSKIFPVNKNIIHTFDENNWSIQYLLK